MALSIGLGQIQNKERTGGHADPLSIVVRAVLTPGTRAVDDVARSWNAQLTSLANGPKTQAELERLRKVEGSAKMYAQTVEGLTRELEQLRTLVGLPNYGRQHVPARIIAYFYNDNRFTLSIGSNQGIKPDMPVVNWQGLLAIVQTVEPDSCQAVMITSPARKFGAMVLRTPEVTGIMKGQTPTRLVLDVLENGKVEPGDPVVTSGLSIRIPRGIPVGTVAEVTLDQSDGTHRIFVAPAARIGTTLEVMVLK